MPLLLMCFRFPNIVHSQDLAALLDLYTTANLWGWKKRLEAVKRDVKNIMERRQWIVLAAITGGVLTVNLIVCMLIASG